MQRGTINDKEMKSQARFRKLDRNRPGACVWKEKGKKNSIENWNETKRNEYRTETER